MRYVKHLGFIFLCVFNSLVASYEVTSAGAGRWLAAGGFYDDYAVLTVPSSGGTAATLNFRNQGSGVSGAFDFSFQYTPQTGRLVWTDVVGQDIYTFDSNAGRWTAAVSSAVWEYDREARSWLQASDEGQVWTFNATTSQWVGNPGTAEATFWVWLAETNQWKEVLSDTLYSYDFTAASSPWGDAPLALMPPLPLVQQLYSQMVMEVFLSAGIFAEGGDTAWTVGALSGESAVFVNTHEDFGGAYTPSVGIIEGSFLSTNALLDGGITVHINARDGSFVWRLLIDQRFTQEWSFDSTVWRDIQTGSVWTYERSSRNWSSDGVVWVHDKEANRWIKNDGEAVWSYDLSTGVWSHTDDEEVVWQWRYLMFAKKWVQVSEHEGMPATGLLPDFAFQQTFVLSLCNACKERDPVVELGASRVWNNFSYDGHFWVSSDATGTRELQYDDTSGLLVGLSSFADEYFVYDRKTGCWTWATDADSDASVMVSYDSSTGTLTGPLMSDWGYDAGAGTWASASDELMWQRDGVADRWRNVVLDEFWVYDAAFDTWTREGGSQWYFNPVTAAWSKVSGGGPSSLNATDYPPVALAVGLRILYAHAFLLACGSELVTVPRPSVTFAPSIDEENVFLGSGLGGDIEARFFDAEAPTLSYVSLGGYQSWSYQPSNAQFAWTAGETTYVFDPEAAQWTDGEFSWHFLSDEPFRVGWSNDADGAEIWVLDAHTARWIDKRSNSVWCFDPQTMLWAHAASQTAWMWLEERRAWCQVSGADTDSVLMPPTVVRQTAFIESVLNASLQAGVVGVGRPALYGFERGDDNVWRTTNASQQLLFSYDAYHPQAGLNATSSYFSCTGWPTNAVTFTWNLDESWQWVSGLNPFRRREFYFDAQARRGGDRSNPESESWLLDLQKLTFKEEVSGALWSYDPLQSTFTLCNSGEIWRYDTGSFYWQREGSDRAVYFDPALDSWVDATDLSTVSVNVPPHYLGALAFSMTLRTSFVSCGALQAGVTVSFQSAVTHIMSPVAITSRLYYTSGRQLPFFWTDIGNYNKVFFAEDASFWTWAFNGQHWHRGVSVWATPGETDASKIWDYHGGDYPSWTNRGDRSQSWSCTDEANAWVDATTGDVWTSSSSGTQWTVTNGDGAIDWFYSFFSGSWYLSGGGYSHRTSFPPLPLVQEVFLLGLLDVVWYTLGSNMEFAGIRREKVPYGAPAEGGRPLRAGRYYERYNAASFLLNAPLTLENMTLVHTDVSRNLARAQLPACTEQALPAIIGGERMILREGAEQPLIQLKNSSVACHESLVSAGVRWAISGDSALAPEGGSCNHDNYSSLVCYNRGRLLDAQRRRGTVFQLGSKANRASDGSALIPLESSFLAVYPTESYSDCISGMPPVIELACISAYEDGVSERDRTTHVLSLALDSHIELGWPTVQASVAYTPWTMPLVGVEEDSDSLFDPLEAGGGRLTFSGGPWSITARDANLAPPHHPVKESKNAGVVYVDYGAELATFAGTRVLLDTAVAVAASPAACAGKVSIPRDQIEVTNNGSVEQYASHFSVAAQTSGLFEGNVLLSQSLPTFSLSKQLQSPTLALVKKPLRRAARRMVSKKRGRRNR